MLSHTTIAAAAADSLRRRILAGELTDGTPLRQDALAQEFGVSRIPIREALFQLEAEGLVTVKPHRGAVVSSLSPGEIEEILELRMLLEPRLLVRSAPRLTSEDFAELAAILAELNAEVRAHRPARWGELNTRLHLAFYRHAGQPRTLAIVTNLLQQCDRLTRVHLSLSRGFKRAEDEHAELLSLCRDGLIERASSRLLAHIAHVRDDLIDFLATKTRR